MSQSIIQKERDLKFLYLVYLIGSWIFSVISVVWILALYIFNWQETITLYDLFKIILAIAITFYFRWNAYHYQNVWQRVRFNKQQYRLLKQGYSSSLKKRGNRN